MKLSLIPQPHRIRTNQGRFAIPRSGCIAIGQGSLYDMAADIADLFPGHAIAAAAPGLPATLTIALDASLKPGAYRLQVAASGVSVAAQSHAAAFHGLQTLRQVAAQVPSGTLPALRIDDWPDFRDRGVYYDVCRGRVPKLERLLEQAELLSRYKINHLQLYVEHTFRFRGHPDIGKGASPLTPEDILQLDGYCRDRHIELVPSLASFGHLATVLKHPQYRHLAEDWGIGKYLSPEAGGHRCIPGWTLSPANPDIYPFLDSLFAEFLPLFTSHRFNVCCDETWDLGLGQSYELCQEKGKGRVYLDHIIKLNELCKKHGKRMMFWGDIIRNHPELVKDVPKDVTVLDWGYTHNMNFDRIRDFVSTGLDTIACPSVCGYVTMFPRIHASAGNIAGWARAGVKHGASGILNTDWGDGGHYNFMECAWYGYLFGAEQSWNARADRSTFTRRFCKLFMGADSAALARAVDELGDISDVWCQGFYQSMWQHVFFARPGEQPLNLPAVHGSLCRNGMITEQTVHLDAPFGRRTVRRLERLREVFVRVQKQSGTDPSKVLPYWVFGVDTMMHAARKLTVLGPGGSDTPAARRALKRELTSLMERFEKLWLARNATSEIRITLRRYRRVLNAL